MIGIKLVGGVTSNNSLLIMSWKVICKIDSHNNILNFLWLILTDDIHYSDIGMDSFAKDPGSSDYTISFYAIPFLLWLGIHIFEEI